MADKTISALPAITRAADISEQSRFILEQNNTARQIQWQVLVSKLTELADGHGGIRSIVKSGTSGTVIEGQTDTYTITYADNTTSTYTVKNGARGLQGYQTYVHVRYADTDPSLGTVSLLTTPSDYIGLYAGLSSTAPTTQSEYTWYKWKGERGETGEPARVTSTSVSYQYHSSPNTIPEGSWYSEQASAAAYWEQSGHYIQGSYLWTRTQFTFNDGQNSEVIYSTAYQGVDGSGLTGVVKSVNNTAPDSTGNVNVTASSVGAIPAPANPSNNAVVKWDAQAQAWVAGNVSSGTVKSVNSKSPDVNGNVTVNASDVIGTGGVTETMLGASAVSTGKIADGAVTDAKIANGAVGTDKLADCAVSSAKIATGAVSSNKLDSNLRSMFAVKDFTVDNISINAGQGTTMSSPNIGLSGYTPIGICGWDMNSGSSGGANPNTVVIRRFFIKSTGTDVDCMLSNVGSSRSVVKMHFFVMYVRTALVSGSEPINE